MLERSRLEACNWILQCEMEPSDLSSADVTTLWKIMDDHPRWSLTWIPRSQNQLAHLIAK